MILFWVEWVGEVQFDRLFSSELSLQIKVASHPLPDANAGKAHGSDASDLKKLLDLLL